MSKYYEEALFPGSIILFLLKLSRVKLKETRKYIPKTREYFPELMKLSNIEGSLAIAYNRIRLNLPSGNKT